MMTTHPFNTLAIGQYTQALNNRLNCYFDGINATQKMKSFFLVGNEDLIDINTCVRTCIKTHCMGCFFKSRFLESIKRKMRKLIPPISGINLQDYSLFDLGNFSRQASLTHALKLPLPATKSICASKSSSKRICLVVLLERSKDFLSFLSCIGYLTSIPRDCNSFRITLFIQPASDSSPSSFCAFSMARRNSGSSLNWNGGLPRLFSGMCIDTPITLVVMYLCVMTCYYHILKKAIPRSVTSTIEGSNHNNINRGNDYG
jgi:hypothetical protein